MIHKYLIAQKFSNSKSYGGEIHAKDMNDAEKKAQLIGATVVGMITEEAPEQTFCRGCLSQMFTYCPMCSGEMDMEGGH